MPQQNTGSYVMPNTRPEQDESYTPNKPQKKHGITKSNRQIAKEVFGADVYDAIDEARKGTEDERVVELHNSLGTRQITQGEPVLEIDFAGSTYARPRKDYKGIVEKAWDEGKDDKQLSDELDSVYGKLVDEERHVREKITEYEIPNPDLVPGAPADPSVPQTVTMSKKRISIAGPGTFNLSHGDANSVEKNKEYISGEIREYLTQQLRAYKAKLAENPDADLKDIHINITGHSRGAVAAGETVLMTDEWLKNSEEFKDLIKYVKYDLIQYDPVPGLGDRTEHGKLDLSNVSGLNSTVVYSMSTEYMDGMFKPQEVSGTNRIIFGVMAHAVNLGFYDGSQPDKLHKVGYYDAATGEVYRGSGLSEIPDGVYFTDEHYNLIKLDSFAQVNKLADAAFEGNEGRQEQRLSVLKNAIKDWFVNHDLETTFTAEEEIPVSEKRLDDLKRQADKTRDYRLQGIVNDIDRFQRTSDTGDIEKAKEDLLTLRDSCRRFMKSVTLPASPEDEKKLDMAAEILTIAQKQRNYLIREQVDAQPQVERTGSAERQLNRDEGRIAKEGLAKGAILEAAAQSKEYLSRLEATQTGSRRSAESYDKLHAALEKVSKLSGKSTLREAQEAFSELEKAGKEYEKSPDKWYRLRRQNRKERIAVSQLASGLAGKSAARFGELTREIAAKDRPIDDLMNRRGDRIMESKGKILSLKDLQQKVQPALQASAAAVQKVHNRERSKSAPQATRPKTL